MDLALLLLLAISSGANVLDDVYPAPAGNWRYIDSDEWRYPTASWKEDPAMLRAVFTVQTGPPVRMLLLDRENLQRLKRGEQAAALRQTPIGNGGTFRAQVRAPEDYVLVVENTAAAGPAMVRVRVWIDSTDAGQLSPQRRLAVLAISFGVFFGIVTYSAARLWRAMRAQGPDGSV